MAYWRMAPEEALRRAKKEIDEAPAVSDDPELYTLLFRNVSVFKRLETMRSPFLLTQHELVI